MRRRTSLLHQKNIGQGVELRETPSFPVPDTRSPKIACGKLFVHARVRLPASAGCRVNPTPIEHSPNPVARGFWTTGSQPLRKILSVADTKVCERVCGCVSAAIQFDFTAAPEAVSHHHHLASHY